MLWTWLEAVCLELHLGPYDIIGISFGDKYGFDLVFLVKIFIVQQVALIFPHPLCDDGGSMPFSPEIDTPEQTKATGESRDRGSGK